MEAVEQSEVLLPEEHHAPLHRPDLLRQTTLLGHGWNNRKDDSVINLPMNPSSTHPETTASTTQTCFLTFKCV